MGVERGYKISVVTVCYNAEKNIGKTIETVINQTYGNIEYILVDGASRDNTVEIIQEYAKKYPLKYISEPDTGIYNAMNKGIGLSTGDYIVFINAGDGFWNKEVVNKVVKFMQQNKGDIFYGNCVRTNNRMVRETQKNNGTFCKMMCGKQPYHQCTFVAKKTFVNNLFDEKYKVRSDYNWFMCCKRKGYVFRYMDFVISRYAKFGYSARSKQRKLYVQETAQIVKNNYPLCYPFFKMNSFL